VKGTATLSITFWHSGLGRLPPMDRIKAAAARIAGKLVKTPGQEAGRVVVSLPAARIEDFLNEVSTLLNGALMDAPGSSYEVALDEIIASTN
jgi:hypothetical protein